VENITRLAAHVRTEMSKVIVGQQEVIDQLLLVLVCGGHTLIEGVPGLAKTLAVKTLAKICGLGFQRGAVHRRIDARGCDGGQIFSIWRPARSRCIAAPFLRNLLLVDEINRTSPARRRRFWRRWKSVRSPIDGTRYPLGENFTVFATQNPIEFEGTYPLPEAQLDRFLLKIRLDYPSAQEESDILGRYEQGFDPRRLDLVSIVPVDQALLAAARQDISAIRIEPTLRPYIVTLVRRTRDWPALSLGASPRAAIGLLFVARALAGVEGRDFLIPDDIKTAAWPVLRHRVLLKPKQIWKG